MEAQVWQEPGLSPGPGTSLWTRLTRPRLLQPLGFRASTVPASASLPRPCSLECSVSYTAQQCAGVLSRGRSLPRVSLTDGPVLHPRRSHPAGPALTLAAVILTHQTSSRTPPLLTGHTSTTFKVRTCRLIFISADSTSEDVRFRGALSPAGHSSLSAGEATPLSL